MPADSIRDPRWQLMEDARHDLLATLANDGVVRIEYAAAFPHVDDFAVWLGASTDAEKDALPNKNPRLAVVRAVLADHGFTDDQLSGLRTIVQSQETVDRDYKGSWFYALR